MENIKPLIIVVGQSGRGKSSSIKNLDPKTTLIFNTESKPLPFKEASKFKNVYVEKPSNLVEYFEGAQEKEEFKTIVIDSFSAWTDLLMEESRMLKKGYDVFNYYNEKIYQLFKLLKKSTKYVILIGHDEVLTTSQGETLKRLKIDGKKWEGVVEKEAVIVLYATMRSDGKGNNSYIFQTQSDGVTSAKTPAGMFEEFEIPNDLSVVITHIEAYYE